ncbi:MAG TPA: NAD(P)-binding protein [Solirubrobacteraceae bacterium]|nr:NAD(P)-binding protein [Solirubrobacteraceae bacterium]
MAVLGGGPAAMVAAFELTDPGLEGRFEVTVYQPGWRLGGKCASGRNRDETKRNRIEEHGLHVWFGFYENSFRVMREAYEALKRPATHPLATIEKAFVGCDEIVLYDRQGPGWHSYHFDCPPNNLVPGTDEPLPGFWAIADTICQWAVNKWKSLAERLAGLLPPGAPEPPSAQPFAWVPRLAAAQAPSTSEGGEQLLSMAKALSSAPSAAEAALAASGQPVPALGAAAANPVAVLLATLLTGFRDWVWDAVARDHCEEDPELRLFFTIFDMFASGVAGVVKDGVLERGWPAINQYELCEWLSRHGAKPVTVGPTPAQRCPLLRAIYDVAFGYPEGDVAKANVAAGTAVNDLLRLAFTYRGSVLYKMQAGMGDTVLTPFYEVLKKRNVKFEFFHAVTHLSLSANGQKVQAIEVVPQATVLRPPYEPLVEVEEVQCWPSTPDWTQLEEGARLEAEGADFEKQINPDNRRPVELVLGQDFDLVVLGIPVGALEHICGEIVEHHEPFARMLASSVTVATQSFQLWLTQSTTALGWSYSQNSVCGCFVEPIDTWCDVTHLLVRESWLPAEGVAGLAYFCGVLADHPGETPAQAEERVKAAAQQFLERDAVTLWPRAKRFAPGEPFDWSVLADNTRAGGSARLGAQYFRANTIGSERYVLTPAGTVADRLAAGESGVQNLVMAGDWTSNGIDGGCVEAAMTSGMQAARALIGGARSFTGESPTWLTDQLNQGGQQP